MAPEQASGAAVDSRTDIWALGAVLHEMLTGRLPMGQTETLPEALGRIVRKALAAEPRDRYQHVEDMLVDLRDAAGSGLFESRRVQSRRSVLAAAGIVAAVAVVAIILWPERRPPGPNEWVQVTRLPDSVGQPALSPDGRMVAFVRGASTFNTAGEIYVKTLPGGEAVPLTHDGLLKMSPVFSPDGSRIAYTVTQGGKWDTWQVDVIGGKARPWLENASGLSWTDKNRVMFSEIKDNNLHMAIVSALENRAEARDVYVPASKLVMAHRSYLSPDGKWTLIVEMDNGPWQPCRLVSMDGKSPARPVGPSNAGCTFAAWSSDGKWMYMSSSAGGAFHTWRQRFPDGVPEQITSGPTEEEGIAMAPDGRSFVTAVAARQSSVWVHGPKGDRQISLEGFAFDPKFTPDGMKLLYRVLKGASLLDSSELRVTDLESGLTEPLLPRISLLGFPSYLYDVSRDGRQAVAVGVDTDGKRRLWLVPLDRRSPPRAITNGETDYGPRFGTDREIFFSIYDGSQGFLQVIQDDGAGLRKVSERPIMGVRGLSPDNRWVVTLAVIKDEERRIEQRGLIARSLTGEADLRLISPAAAITLTELVLKWSPDGRTVYFVSAALDRGHNMRAYSFPLQPGKMFPPIPPQGFRLESEMAKVPGAKAFDVYDYAPGPVDGVYAFTRESVQRNLYRVPLR